MKWDKLSFSQLSIKGRIRININHRCFIKFYYQPDWLPKCFLEDILPPSPTCYWEQTVIMGPQIKINGFGNLFEEICILLYIPLQSKALLKSMACQLLDKIVQRRHKIV